jgi:RNA polymerase sigma-70 factor (ECF subfamily)
MAWQRLNKGKHRRELLQEQIVALLPRLRRFARNLTGDADSADDLVQMACERALQRLHQYRDNTRLDSWLYRIVYTQWIDRTRRKQRRASQQEALREDQEDRGKALSSPGRLVSFMDVKNALGQLAQEHRAAILLVAVEGHTYSEAAGVLGVPAGTVASRVARARRSLAAHFHEEHPRLLSIRSGS